MAMGGVATAALSVIKKSPATSSQTTAKIKSPLYPLVILPYLVSIIYPVACAEKKVTPLNTVYSAIPYRLSSSKGECMRRTASATSA